MSKTAFDAPRGNHFRFDPDEIVIPDDPQHPLYDERIKYPIDRCMVEDIKRNGVRQNIQVRKLGDGFPHIVFGKQRVRNARVAKKELIKDHQDWEIARVPGFLIHDDEATCLESIIAENNLRTEDAPLDKARKFVRLMKLKGLSLESTKDKLEAARSFKVTSVTTVDTWLALLQLTTKVQKAIDAGQVSASQALVWKGLSPKEQEEALQKYLDSGDGNTTDGNGKKKSKKERAEEAAGKDPTPRMRTRKQIEKRLEEDSKLSPSARSILEWVLGQE